MQATPTGTGAGTTNIISIPGSNEILTINGVVPIHDALGTVLGGVDSSGGFAYQYTYDPFGKQTLMPGASATPSGYGNVYGMAGMEYDGAIGLFHPLRELALSGVEGAGSGGVAARCSRSHLCAGRGILKGRGGRLSRRLINHRLLPLSYLPRKKAGEKIEERSQF